MIAKSVFESSLTTAMAKAKSITVVIIRAKTITPVFSVSVVGDILDLDDTISHNDFSQ